jgi:hypothetical protein
MRTFVLFVAAFSTLALAGDKGFSPPPATHAKSYPLHETHEDESVVIALDPYDTAEKTSIFRVKYRTLDLLPIRLIISNDGSKPLMLDDLKVEYVTAHRDKLPPATKDDIIRRIARPEKVTQQPTVRLPIPGPRKQPAAVNKDALHEVEEAQFVPVPVTPNSTNSGFLFFDISDIDKPEAGAHLYISGIRAGTKELFYFDIPLTKNTNAPAERP